MKIPRGFREYKNKARVSAMVCNDCGTVIWEGDPISHADDCQVARAEAAEQECDALRETLRAKNEELSGARTAIGAMLAKSGAGFVVLSSVELRTAAEHPISFKLMGGSVYIKQSK